MNSIDDLEVVHPKPFSGNSVFYICPEVELLAVSCEGLVLNTKTLKQLSTYTTTDDTVIVSLYSNGKLKSYSVHRLLASVFVGRPSRHLDKSLKCLEVNHVDGNRRNNEITNLEWITTAENSLHGHLSGLFPRDKPVLAKNVKTGEVLRFLSSKQCADRFEIHRATFWKHLEQGDKARFHKNGSIFKYDDGEIWPDVDFKNLKELGNGNQKRFVKMKDIKKSVDYLFPGLKESCKHSGLSLTTVWRNLNKHGIYKTTDFEVSFA